MTIQHLYPTTRPTLDLNFARQKRLDPRVTFTRGSTATYVGDDGLIKTAASNEARFDHDPATGESLGLLIEESRTNLVTVSENAAGSLGYTTTATFDLDVLTAPDGTTTADRIVTSGAGQVRSYANNLLLAGQTGTLSLFLKAGTITSVTVDFNTTFAQTTVDLINGTTSSSSSTIHKLPNNWYRVTLTWTATANKGYRVRYGGAGNFYVWGVQLELGSFPTSYIPTSGSTVTRSADVASMTGTNFSSWYNQSEGTVFADTTDLGYPANVGGSFWKIFASTSHTSGRNSINMTRSSGGALPEARFGIIDQNGAGVVDLFTTSPPTSAKVKSAIGLQSGSYAASSHGNTVVTSSAAVPPTFVAADTLAFGQATNSTTQQKSCLVARLTYYPTRLTDAQLQELTR